MIFKNVKANKSCSTTWQANNSDRIGRGCSTKAVLILFSLFFCAGAGPATGSPVLKCKLHVYGIVQGACPNNHYKSFTKLSCFGQEPACGWFAVGSWKTFDLLEDTSKPQRQFPECYDVPKTSFMELVQGFAAYYHMVLFNPQRLNGCKWTIVGEFRQDMPIGAFIRNINSIAGSCIHLEVKNDTLFLMPPIVK